MVHVSYSDLASCETCLRKISIWAYILSAKLLNYQQVVPHGRCVYVEKEVGNLTTFL